MNRQARYPAIAPEDMTEAQRALVAEISSGPRGGIRGPFIPLLHHPELASLVQRLGEFVRYRTRLSTALVELAVLVAARRWTCQFEWYAHAPLASKAGLSPAMIEAIAQSRRPAGMSDDEAIVHDACVEIHETGRLSDKAFDAAAIRFGREGALEIVAICGYYTLLAFVLNVANDPLPGGAPAPLA